jgi:hypothetical protein
MNLRSMINRRLLRLRPADWAQLMIIGIVAARVEYGLRHRRLPALAASLGIRFAEGGTARTTEGSSDVVPDWAVRRLQLVNAGMRRWPYGDSCLRVALVGGHRIRALHPELIIGVARDNGELKAHAWLVVAGVTLDPSAPKTFKQLHHPTGSPR